MNKRTAIFHLSSYFLHLRLKREPFASHPHPTVGPLNPGQAVMSIYLFTGINVTLQEVIGLNFHTSLFPIICL